MRHATRQEARGRGARDRQIPSQSPGDGIHDAPALATADVGLAMSSGTDVAMESAGVTLLHGDLNGIIRPVGCPRGRCAASGRI